MYIEIEKDILDDALNKNGLTINASRDILIAMALCARQGKHYIAVPALRGNSSLKQQLGKLLGNSYVELLDYTNRKYRETVILKNKVCVRVVLTIQNTTGQQGNVISVNPLESKEFEPWTETFVLTENLIDSKFFSHAAKYFMRKEGVKSCKMAFYPLMGGGVTMEKVMEQEVNMAKHLCLAVADSDKKYPDDSVKDTAGKLLKQLDMKPFNCTAYIMDKVMEIENLIPSQLVIKYGDGGGYKEIFMSDPSFFDMKKGLTLECLYKDKAFEYWKSLITDEENRFNERDEKIKNCTCEKDYYKKVRDVECIKNGFGKDLLANVLNPKGHKKCLNLEDVGDKDLNVSQQSEWCNIGKIMFSWTCACKAI